MKVYVSTEKRKVQAHIVLALISATALLPKMASAEECQVPNSVTSYYDNVITVTLDKRQSTVTYFKDGSPALAINEYGQKVRVSGQDSKASDNNRHMYSPQEIEAFKAAVAASPDLINKGCSSATKKAP